MRRSLPHFQQRRRPPHRRGQEVPYLGTTPIDPAIAASGDDGRPYVNAFAASAAALVMRGIIAPLLALEADEK